MDLLKPLKLNPRGGLTVVSNRGPYTFRKTARGIQATPSVSGLVSAIQPVIEQIHGRWVAWGGRYGTEEETLGRSLTLQKTDKWLFHEVMLTEPETAGYYEGMCNGCLWPLCHNFIEKSVFDEEMWGSYRRVNRKFAEVVLQTTGPGDMIWVQDFHLALLPGYICRQRPGARVSVFWHIPFPPPEIFTVLPWAKEIIKGLLNCEFIGFHTEGYVRNFLLSVREIYGVAIDFARGLIFGPERIVRVGAVPIGIDCREFENLAAQPGVIRKAAGIRSSIGGDYVIISVDRLDYTKGIPERLQALEYLLESRPEYKGKLTFVQIAVPSRTDVAAYRRLRRQIEEIVGRINGKYTKNFHVPIRYLFKPLSREDLAAHYLAADMAVVTPLKDGLNLVAKEYVAVKSGGGGVLILSPFAGAAVQLTEALTANPYNLREMANQIVAGIELDVTEKKRRMLALARSVREEDINWWWQKIQQNWLIDSETVGEPPPDSSIGGMLTRGAVL
ncbi:alpha,alpha-trehalose-phosphate synthase (UDP-forming) [Phosphitispora fastidiosa]|uniref:alpha,alpha-trehalose-phosphate synthase (UDP-forming) n=1 Tax=Phosphitispora fastidiosa TaxID=2837202 RepID=UPI001E418C7D|nr:trehalose-6-phosphate synthase [Phosphitispora fastidiosa]MBU7008346.1 trehalose 6-phosphate synthase [Phosphitispora fastidiosa]